MKRILCLAFVLISSISILAQEKIIEKSDSGKTSNGPILKAEGKLTPTFIINKNKDEITEVSLERKGCHGFCPIDKVTFSLNGPHSYKGIKFVDLIGNFQAELEHYKLSALVKVLERVNYADLKDEYMRVIDSQVVILSVTRGGKTKTIKSDSSETTPIEFVIIQAFIENVTPKIRWKKVGQ
jgi:hypothetical protein